MATNCRPNRNLWIDQDTTMTKIRKLHSTLLAVSTAILLAASPLAAQELAPEQLELARKYVDLTDQSKVFEASVVQTGINTMKTLLRPWQTCSNLS